MPHHHVRPRLTESRLDPLEQRLALTVATILDPDNGDFFSQGQRILLHGSAVSTGGSAVPSANFEWRVALHDRGRSRGLIEPIRSVSTAAFNMPRLPALTDNAFVRVALIVTETGGDRDRDFVDILPLAAGSPQTAPDATITQVTPRNTFSAGQRISFFGSATDAEDGTLPASAFVWRAALHVDGSSRGITQSIRNVRQGSFTLPQDLPALDSNDFLRLTLTVTDSDGLRSRDRVDLAPANPVDDNEEGSAPEPQILLPAEGTFYSVGDVIQFSGIANDNEDAVIAPSGFEWRFTLHEGDRVRQLRPTVGGVRSGSFTIPSSLRGNGDQFIRITLVATDSDNNTGRTSIDIQPRLSQLTIVSNFPDVDLVAKVDGKTRLLPLTTESVAGSRRRVSAPAVQRVDGATYQFVRWSDGGARVHRLRSAQFDQTLTAIYRLTDFERSDVAPARSPAPSFSNVRIPNGMFEPQNDSIVA